MGKGIGIEAPDQGPAEEEAIEASPEVIDPRDAEHAEKFECYCGRTLDVAPAIVCTGCDYPPIKCTCEELTDGKTNDAQAGR